MKTAIELIAEERQRQIEVEGWSAEHDDHSNHSGKLALAAACYAMPPTRRSKIASRETMLEHFWPWFDRWWKPNPDDRERELVKAAALIVAEIDRLRRLKESTENLNANTQA